MSKYVCYEGKDVTGKCNGPCEGCSSYGVERRLSNRRKKSFSFRLLERREGFDRRKNHLGKKGLYQRVFRQGAYYLRHNYAKLIILLILFNMLNVADFIFTLRALSYGFSEGNPVMNMLFTVGPSAAGLFKFALAGVITVAIWLFRRYRLVLEFSIFFLFVYMLLIAYHIYGTFAYHIYGSQLVDGCKALFYYS
ncbi:MAG: DUF5658 family protein [Firmicutes bacterium]|nr:DUF5658 family protein [Bacillota bacterium]